MKPRLHSLEKSCDDGPTCLVFVLPSEVGRFVLGHSRISPVPGQNVKSCLVESVVVKISERGKGFGRKVMEETENFAKSKGYKVMFLSTHDKQDFYSYLGYKFCPPVVSFGCNAGRVPDSFIQKFVTNVGVREESSKNSKDRCQVSGNVIEQTQDSDPVLSSVQLVPSIPPPAPPPLPTNAQVPPIPPPSAPPPPPTNAPVPPLPPPPGVPTPPPPPSMFKPSTQNCRQDTKDKKPNISKWDPSCISWMRKDLL